MAHMLQSRHRPSFASEQRRGDATGTGRIPIRNVCNVPTYADGKVRYLGMRKLHKKLQLAESDFRTFEYYHHYYYLLVFSEITYA